TLRKPYSGDTLRTYAKIKNTELIADDSLITANCYGMEWNNKWVKTASDAVLHLVKNDSGFTEVNEESFSQAKYDSPHIISVILPKRIGDEAPTVKEVITDINGSVMGSLYGNR